ncbi:MAG: recombinase family protein [Candidatus Methanomethylophilaceae archaeon]|nr:recombinase family protein [Candidatus Methanomethylophilaceae archaeon]
MQTERSMRAALYTRVSTEEQANEGFSLDAQMRRLEMYCEMEGWTVAGRYREEGHSGRDTRKRPEYQRMMDEKDQWDVVLVLKMDRIHRNSKNFTHMMEDLQSWDKQFCSVQEQFDTGNAMGRFVMDLMQRIAQLESEQIGERVKLGMERKAKLGRGLLGSGHPYGYEYNHGQLKVVDDEMYTVRAIYNMYRKDYTMEFIAEQLNDAMIPAKKGGKWNKQSVCNILHNPLYAGYVEWDGKIRQGNHTAVIDRETFEAINGTIIPVI